MVKPLLKKPHLYPGSLNNYRPVSNLPFLSTVFERVVFQQLSGYLVNKISWNLFNRLSEPVTPPGILLDWLESQFGISSLAKIVPVQKNTMCLLQEYFISFYWCETWSSPGLCSGPFVFIFIYFTSWPNYSELWNTFPLLHGRHSAVCANKSWWWISNHEIRDCLYAVKKWMSENFLFLNSDKSKMLVIAPAK